MKFAIALLFAAAVKAPTSLSAMAATANRWIIVAWAVETYVTNTQNVIPEEITKVNRSDSG